MINWSLILHFYQPPTQTLSITDEVLASCYLPLLEILENHPEAHFTLNLTGSLLLQIEALKNEDFFTKINALIDRGQIELLNCPIFHPILPLVSPTTALRQLNRNKEVLNRLFPKAKIQGIFCPELAVNEAILDLLKDQTEYVIVDESSLNPNFDLNKIIFSPLHVGESESPSQPILLTSSRSLTELLRSYPTELKTEKLIQFIKSHLSSSQPNNHSDSSIVSCNDAELFGHHYQERIYLLKDLLESKEIHFISASETINNFKFQISNFKLITPSTWQSTPTELKNHDPYNLWLDPQNPLQQEYYELMTIAEKSLNGSSFAQDHFDQGASSCHLYWLSNRPWWHPDFPQAGATHLIEAVRMSKVDRNFKLEVENLYHNFLIHLWHYHSSGEVENHYRKYDDERREFLKSLPDLK